MKRTPRETAYRTLKNALSLCELARELGVSKSFVRSRVNRGGLLVNGDGMVSGVELARYLIAHRGK